MSICFNMLIIVGVNTDEVDSQNEDWDEVTVEILIDEEDIILKEQE